MKNIKKYILMLLILIVVVSCQRQELGGSCYVSARIYVDVNWDNSGINPTKVAFDDVHRVSLRFFPKDGSEPFERYLETNVYGGYIEVPMGDYSIMAMNESVKGIYLKEFFKFTDIDDFDKIAATVVDDDPSKYTFYTPSSDEQFMKAARMLASWSTNAFEVTQDMIVRTHVDIVSPQYGDTIRVNMRRLTYDTRVLVTVKNLKSAYIIQGALRGFSQKVYLSSAVTELLPSTQFFRLGEFVFNEGSTSDGTTETTFKTFGKLPQGALASYSMMLDVLLVDGSRHIPEVEYDYDLTENINLQNGPLINIAVSIELPEVNGGIGVGDWEDEEDVIIK